MAVTAQGSGTKTSDIGTFTVTIASPAVFSKTNQLAAGDKVVFSTTGALPTGLTAGTTYYVISAGLSGSAFEVSATDGGAAINTSGSQSGTHSMYTEHFLTNPNSAGTFTMHADLNAMAAGDVIEFRIYQMVLTGGTPRVAYYAKYEGGQPTDDLISVGVPISNELTDTNSLRFSMLQRYGTARAVPWKVLKHA